MLRGRRAATRSRSFVRAFSRVSGGASTSSRRAAARSAGAGAGPRAVTSRLLKNRGIEAEGDSMGSFRTQELSMRGEAATQATMLTAVAPDALVPQSHPIRRIKPMVDSALATLSPTFSQMYASVGRPSIPPEHLLKCCLLMALFSVRSERQLCERLEYDMLFKWFLDMNILDASFNHSVFSKNKERLLEADVSREFFREISRPGRGRGLLSDEHFSVDGTLLEAWASMKSFRPKGEDSPAAGGRRAQSRGRLSWGAQGERDPRVETDPFARLARRGSGKEARLCYEGHVLMDNRQGMVVDVKITEATGASDVTPPSTCFRWYRAAVGSQWVRTGVRHEGLRMGLPGYAHHTARGPETTLGNRWTDHPARRIQVVSACAQAG